MDNIKEQITWLRAQHDRLALSESTITGYSEAADTMEKLLAVYEAVEALREYPTCNYRIVNGNQVELIGLRPLVKAVAAVQTKQETLYRSPVCLDKNSPDYLKVPIEVVCHAPGDTCAGCDHYYGKAAKCRYAPDDGRHET